MDKTPEIVSDRTLRRDRAGSSSSDGETVQPVRPDQGRGVRVRIGWKITAILVVVMTLLAVINVLFVRDRFNSIMNREFESKAMAIALTIVRTNEEKIGNRDFASVQAIMDGYKEVHGVSYIYVRDPDGYIGAGVFNRGYSEKLIGLNPVKGDQDYKIARFVVGEVGDILEVAVPVLYGAAGTLHVGMDHGIIVSELGQITSNLIMQFAFASILVVILLHLIINFLLRHMKTILNVLGRVGSGDLTVRVNVPTRDEFLDLASHLNSTLSQLGSIIEKVDQSYEGISQANESITRV